MRREIDDILIDWKTSYKRKPLLLRGARQIGKTYSIRELGRSFDTLLEINFEEDRNVVKLFDGGLSPDLLCENLSAYYAKEITPGKTLLFFDEVQQCPEALSALRFFYEKMPDLHVVASGSLLEFALERIPSVGVGRIKSVFMYPLSFREFLVVSDEERLSDAIRECAMSAAPLSDPLHQKAIRLFKTFQMIGGLPEVVDAYINKKNINLCCEILDGLIITFRDDFAKYKERVNVSQIDEVFSSVALQSGGKFKYSQIDSLSSHQPLKESLDLLEKAGLIYKVTHTSANGLPLGAEVNPKKFKAIFFDTGLHQRMLGFDISNYILKDDFETVNKGALAEIFTGLEIMKYSNPSLSNKLHYWHREAKSSNAEIDYVIQMLDHIIPVEVKSGKTGSLKSLHSFMTSHQSQFGLKISLANFAKNDQVLSLPLYALGNLFRNSTDYDTLDSPASYISLEKLPQPI